MALEHRLLLDLSDIVAVTFECVKCSARLSLKPEKVDVSQLRQCQWCGKPWLANDSEINIRGGPFTLLLVALRAARQLPAEEPKVGFTLFFEFASPVK